MLESCIGKMKTLSLVTDCMDRKSKWNFVFQYNFPYFFLYSKPQDPSGHMTI